MKYLLHILCRNLLSKHVVEGKTKGYIRGQEDEKDVSSY
jgi:hypothetical protein